jgi:hypothetical protein
MLAAQLAGPNAPEDVLRVMRSDAQDLGTHGFDPIFGYGFIQTPGAQSIED